MASVVWSGQKSVGRVPEILQAEFTANIRQAGTRCAAGIAASQIVDRRRA